MKRLGLIFAAIVVAIMLLVVGGVALAAPSSVPDAGSVQTDGRVWTILRLGDRVYLGGDFTHVNGVVRNRLAAINATTGKLTNWNPNANGSVRTLAASQDGARLYAGGAFTAVFGQSRPYLVGLDAANTGATVWRPLTNPNGAIFDVVARGANVYGAEGGSGGAAAAYEASTGISTWILHARGDGDVQALAYLDGNVYLGGHFTGFSAQDRRFFAAVDASTGMLDTWNPRGGGAGLSVWTLEADPLRMRIYAGGDFTNVSGVTRKRFAQFSE